MEEKNLFDRRPGDIRGRLRQEQTSTTVDGPMEVQDYNDYQYSEPSRQEIETDLEQKTTNKGLSDILGSFTSKENRESLDKAADKRAKELQQVREESKKRLEKDPLTLNNWTNSRLDEAFSFLDGVMSVRIGSIRGDLQRVNKSLDDKLNFLKDVASSAQEMNQYKQLMDTTDNLEEFNDAYNKYQNAAKFYKNNKLQSDKYLQEFHDTEKDINGFSPISKIKNSTDFINFINERKAENDIDAKSKIEDMKSEQAAKRWINSLYSISPEYLEKQQTTDFAWTDPSTWRYTLPNTMGSSFSSIGSMATSIAIATASNYISKQLPASVTTGGISTIPALALSLGAAIGTTWANVSARQQESNAEVYDNYKQNLYGLAEQGQFDLTKVVAEGRKLVKDYTGVDTTKLTDEEVLDDMLLYNINTSDTNFNTLRRTSREGLQRLYDQNMALAVSDIGQAALVIPGVGTMFSKAASAVGAKALGEGVSKAASKMLDNTAKGIANKMSGVTVDSAKRVLKNVISPTAKLGLDTVLEGNEEAIQYVAGKDYISGKYKNKPSNWFNTVIEDLDASYRGITGILGIGPDQALNNDKELAQNFKLGAALGLFMGGAMTIPKTVKDFSDEVAGTSFAKKLTAEHIRSKEDTDKIKLYAADALSSSNRREAYFDYMESMKEDLPVGLTVEDIDNEINRAKKAFNLIDSPTIKKVSKDINTEVGTDKYNTLIALAVRAQEAAKDATNLYMQSRSKYDNLFAAPEVSEFLDGVQVPMDQRNRMLEYIKLRTEQRGIDTFLSELTDTKSDLDVLSKNYGFSVNKSNIDDYIIESTRMLNETRDIADMMQKDFIEQYGEDAVLYDRIDDIEHAVTTSLPEVLVNALSMNQAIFRNSIYQGVRNGNRKFGKKSIKNASKYIQSELDKYYTVQEQNAQLNSIAMTEEQQQEAPVVTGIEETSEYIQSEIQEKAQNDATSGATVVPSIDVEPAVEVPAVVEQIEEVDASSNIEQKQEEKKPEIGSSEDIFDNMLSGDTNDGVTFTEDNNDTLASETVPETAPEVTQQSSEEVDAGQDVSSSTEVQQVEEASEDLFDMMLSSDIIEGQDTIVPNVVVETEPETVIENKENTKQEEDLKSLHEIDSDEWDDLVRQLHDKGPNPVGLTAGTVFFTKNAMFSGYENGEAFNQLLSDPRGLDDADITVLVGKPGAKFNEKYVVEDRQTWDDAAIYVQVTKDNKKYIGALRTIDGAYNAYDTQGKEVNEEDINNLRKLRTQVLEARLAYGPDVVLKPNIVKRTNGKFNVNRDSEGKAIRRPLSDIKGFNIPKDIRKLTDDGINFGIGRGSKNHFLIVDPNGLAMRGTGASGKMYIFLRNEDTPSNRTSPAIKLNELRFSDAPDLADLLYTSLVEQRNGTNEYILNQDGKTYYLDSFLYRDITEFLVNEGEHTLVKGTDREEYAYLLSKQLFYNRDKDVYHVGPNIWKRSYLLTPKGKSEFINYALNNFHINTNESTIYEQLTYRLYRFAFRNKLDRIEISKTLYFDKEDLGSYTAEEEAKFDEYSSEAMFGLSDMNYRSITRLQYMVKHGWLLSDLKDQVFKDSFLYIQDVQPVSQEVTTEEKIQESVAEQPTITENNVTGVMGITDMINDKEWRDMYGFDKVITKKEYNKSKKINTERAKQWLSSKLGLTEDQVIVHNGAIKTFANGSVVIGTTLRDSILLSDSAVLGTEYHEAYHRVSTLLISKAQRQKLYEEYRKQHTEYKDASDKLVEEQLAEGFRSFMLKRDKPIYSILKWFNPIASFIRKMLGINPNEISTIYSSIAKGDFANYRLDEEQYREFDNAYPHGAFFTVGEGDKSFKPKAFTDLSSYYKAIKSLSAALLFINKVSTIDDISKINTKLLRDSIASSINSLPESPRKSSLQEIYDHFDDVFMPDVLKELSNLAIRVIDRDRNKEMEDSDAVNTQNIQYFDRASYEVSKKDNALGSAKMFIATMPKVYFKYDEVNGTKVRTVKPEMDSLTGLPNYIDFDTSWNTMLNNLYNVETWQDLIDKSTALSESNPFFYVLSKRLSRVQDSNLQTQLLQTVKSNKHNMFTVKYGTKPGMDGKTLQVYWTIDDSSLDRALLVYPATWSQLFYNSNYVVVSEDGTTLNKEGIDNIIAEATALFNEATSNDVILTDGYVDSMINRLVAMLNKVGIAIDRETIDSLLEDPKIKRSVDTRASTLVNLFKDSRNGSLRYLFNDNFTSLLKGPTTHKTNKGEKVRSISNIYEGLGKNSIVSLIAKHYANVHPNPEELMVLGANNNLLYPISQNCFMSDQVRWLNESARGVTNAVALNQLSQVTYAKNSLIRKALETKKEIKLNTFVNFKSEEGGDKGRDYMQISPIEDYLSKLALTTNNHIVLPTMADKKMYFTISGVRLFNMPILVRDRTIEFDQSTIDAIKSIGTDEINTIIEFYNNQDKVKDNKDLSVKNYHDKKLGGRFRHFTHLYKTIDGKHETIDLNAELDKHDKLGDTPLFLENLRKQLFSTKSDSTYVTETINDVLKYLLATELKSVTDLGIIRKDDTGLYHNILLDQSRLEDLKQYYISTNGVDGNLAEHYAILSIIGNNAVNTAISIIEVEKVFTGDPAFYKNTDDKIKRLSSVLSTGDNLRTQWDSNHPLANRQLFNATELEDNEIQSAQYDELLEMFTKSYTRKYIMEFYDIPEQLVDSELQKPDSKKLYPEAYTQAEVVAAKAVNGYGLNSKGTAGKINQADAAVYISPRMYKDIVQMLGEWSPSIEKAYDLMESNSDWLNDPKLYAESLQTLIKPLKMMYYGQHLIPELNIQVPIFDKMAMFPMFKAIATGDNLELYNRMTASDKYQNMSQIDMVAFGSAVKAGSRSPMPFYTDHTNNSISDLTKMSVFKQEFKYLRRQLVTDPHHADRQMLGTQVAKAAVSNLVMNRVYGEGKDVQYTGMQIRNNLFGAMNALSDLGVDRLKEKLFKDDELDIDKLSAMLIQDAKASGMGYEVINGMQTVDGEFNVPLSALSDNKWISSRATGMFNREVIDINMPGGAFIQMSSFGFKSINTSAASAFNKGNRLKFNISSGKSKGSMDSIVSINLFSHMIPNYNRLSFVQAKQWLIDNNIIGNSDSVSPVAMGYRIPTQGLSSISSLRIVDVLPSNIGDTVILPDEFTALTGSDFDIDKLYIARYNYETYEDTDGTIGKDGLLRTVKKAKKVEFDWNKEGENIYTANSRQANENLLLDMYMAVLTDSKNVDETRLPLDNTTDILKNEILPIVDGPENDKGNFTFKWVSPTFQLNKKYEYSGGKSGIAPFALNNVHHVLTQLTNFNFKPSPTLKKFGFGSLKGINSRNVTDYERDKYGKIIENEVGNRVSKEERGERILDWLSAMINAHVDVAKDPYIIRLNVVQWTYNMADFLLRSGYGKDTFFFLPQPILKDIAAEVAKTNGKYGVDSKKSASQLEADAINRILEKYYNKALSLATEDQMDMLTNLYKLDAFNTEDKREYTLDRSWLIKQLQDSRKSDKDFMYYYNQIAVYKTFDELTPYAKELAELVHLSQVDTKKFGNNFALQKQFIYKIKDFIINNNVFDKADLVNFYQDTFLDTKIRNGILMPNDVFKNIMVTATDGFSDAFSKMLQWIGQSTTKDETTLKIVSNELEASIKGDFFSKYVNDNNIDVYGMYYGENSMAKRLARLKTDILVGKYSDMLSSGGTILNELLNYLTPEFKQLNEVYNSPDIIVTPANRSNDSYLQERLTKYWEELLTSPYEDVKKFAKDLVVYSFYSSGDNFNKNSFFNLLPNYYRKDIGYAEHMSNAMSSLNDGSYDIFLDNVFRNTWYNNNLVRETMIGKGESALYSTKTIKGISYPVVITGSNKSRVVGLNSAKQPIFRPYIKYNLDKTNNPETTVLYKYVGYFTDKDNGILPIYYAVNKKGMYLNGKVIREYDSYADSMLSFNNIPYVTNINDIFEIEDYTDKAGTAKKRFKNANITSKIVRDKWKDIITNATYIEDFNVFDAANYLTYDEVMTLNMERLESKKEDVTVGKPINPIDVNESMISTGNVYRFKDGFEINVPFTLNPQQVNALNNLETFINNPASFNNEITLTGYAGTGKTTIMGLFDKYLKRRDIYPVYSAVTYRANSVTKANNPNATTYTLNQLFGISAEIDLSDSKVDLRKIKNEQKYRPKIERGMTIVIDEASMVSSAFYNFIQQYKAEYGIHVIYVGDPAQLAPIGESGISPVFTSENNKVIKLTQVMRTGDNPILTEATNLRNGKELSYVTSVNEDGEGVIYTNNVEEANNAIKEAFASEQFKTNKLYFRVLSAVNDQIPTINNMVRNAIFSNPKQIEEGDILMGYDNWGKVQASGEPKIVNSGDYEVVKVTPTTLIVPLPTRGNIGIIRNISVQGYTILVKDVLSGSKELVEINVADNNTPNNVLLDIANEIEFLYANINKAYRSREFSIAKKNEEMLLIIKDCFSTMKNLEVGGRLKIKKLFDYGYAHTIHKSQGGTYNQVLIYADTINRFQSNETRQQLKYVAVSRAKEKVTILTTNKLGIKEEIESTDKFAQLKQEETKATDTDIFSTMLSVDSEIISSKDSLMDLTLQPKANELSREAVIAERRKQLYHIMQEHESLESQLDTTRLEEIFEKIIDSNQQTDVNTLNNKLIELLCQY